MNELLKLDLQVFELINQAKLYFILDDLLTWWRHPLFWGPLYLFLVSYIFFNYGKKAYWVLLFSLLTFGTSDMISSQLIKKNVKRLRPCRTEQALVVTQRVYCGSGYSFTSSHATNHSALAVFWFFVLGDKLQRFKYFFILWAVIMCFAQVYVGVHFPSDVLAGFILGSSIGYLWVVIYRKYYGHETT